MKEVNFIMITEDGLEISKTFLTVNEFVADILNNDDIDSAISIDNELKSFSVETACLNKGYFHTVRDLFLFCKGILYARAE